MDWNMVEAISTAATGAILLGSVPLAFLELHHNRNNIKKQALADLFRFWGDTDKREDRRFIIRNKITPEIAKLMYDAEEGPYVELRKRVEATVTMCDRLSYLVEKKLIPEQDVYEQAGLTMSKLWDSLQPYVACARGQSPARGTSFERIVMKYRAKFVPTQTPSP